MTQASQLYLAKQNISHFKTYSICLSVLPQCVDNCGTYDCPHDPTAHFIVCPLHSLWADIKKRSKNEFNDLTSTQLIPIQSSAERMRGMHWSVETNNCTLFPAGTRGFHSANRERSL